ncbi:MAG TPA: hypothetical protein VK190_02770 [Pseudoneobacillus sp.]|nr:hypothetical protein [Pseudoneobacillus sp.]
MDKRQTSISSVGYILDRVPEANESYILLVLLYWKLFDGIDIPVSLMREIIEKGTAPESITRLKRMIKGRNSSE